MTYEAYALRYGTSRSPRSTRFHRYDARFGDGDALIGMDFYFWLLRDADRTVLVDCGFSADQTEFPRYRHSTHPLELLKRMDVGPGEVDHVILTHMHFDHIGNVGLFPNARFTMARAELNFWTGPLGAKPDIGIGSIPAEVEQVQRLVAEGRVDLVDGQTSLFPGLSITPLPGHTPGQLVTEIDTKPGRLVLASDAMHFYEEMEKDLPFWLFTNLEGMYGGYALLRDLAAKPGVTLIAGHDPVDADRFAAVADDCFDLSRPLRIQPSRS